MRRDGYARCEGRLDHERQGIPVAVSTLAVTRTANPPLPQKLIVLFNIYLAMQAA